MLVSRKLGPDPTFVVTMGTHGSSSTWIFNVVRRLLEASDIPFNSGSNESVESLLTMPLKLAPVTLLKVHGASEHLISLMKITRTRLIVSTRDPRDSALSQLERFEATLCEAAEDLSRALSSIAMIPARLPRLAYRYEDRFMDDPETIRQIARFIGIPTTRKLIASVFDALRPEAVRRQIEAHQDMAAGRTTQDLTTQWNRTHLGDGRVGKWKDRLPVDYATAVEGALCTLENGKWRTGPLRWSSDLFRYDTRTTYENVDTVPTNHAYMRVREDNDIGPGDTKIIYSDSNARVIIFGPYLYLPSGRWKARFHLATMNGEGEMGKVDVYLPGADLQIAEVLVNSEDVSAHGIELDFKLSGHYERIEFRFLTKAGSEGVFSFRGATLEWVGGADMD